MTLVAGTTLGRYQIKSLLGAGGMGEVYRAHDPKIGRDAAIKVLPPDFSADKERLARFEQEAQAAGSLNHPNVLAIYDVDTYTHVPSGNLTGDRNHFVAAADGQRFLVNNVVDEGKKQPITLVLNWAGDLKR